MDSRWYCRHGERINDGNSFENGGGSAESAFILSRVRSLCASRLQIQNLEKCDGVAMSHLLLKMIFYMTTGVIMASISWSTISHSRVTGDYVLAIILLGAMFFIVGMFIVDRCQPKLSERDFHPTKPWKTPYVTTRRGLWKRVAFITLSSMALYGILGLALLWTTTAQLPFLIMLGTLFLLRVPHLYWSMRGRYEMLGEESDYSYTPGSLVYLEQSNVGRFVKLVGPSAMAVFGAGLAGFGFILN